jgi:methylenetetrahydrofolate reductase (NADPH)
MAKPTSTTAMLPDVSFEFFPPRSDAMVKTLWQTVARLETLDAGFASVTDGAGGTGGDLTFDVVDRLRRDSRLEPAAHMACVGRSAAATETLARAYWESGIRRIVALRGDARDDNEQYDLGPYRYAVDLVAGLKRIADFDISVAAYPEVHPEALSAAADLENLERKIDAGATRAITQFFFDNDAFLRFRDRARALGISAPIVPGILPVTNFERAADFAAKCGARIPAGMADRFAGLEDSGDRRQAAVDFAVEQCRVLMAQGIDGFHFYTLNRAEPTMSVCQLLGLGVNQQIANEPAPRSASALAT